MGGSIWVRDESACRSTTGDGYPLFYQGIMIDVSDRHRAEEALRDSEERFRSAFDAAGDRDGGRDLTAAPARQPAHCEMLGYERSRAARDRPDRVIHPDDAPPRAEARGLLRGESSAYRPSGATCTRTATSSGGWSASR